MRYCIGPRGGGRSARLARLTAGGQTSANRTALELVSAGTFKFCTLATGLIEKRHAANPSAFGQFRPPLHFRRKPLVEEQMRLWSARKAARALSILNDAERACRSTAAGLAQAQAGQALLRIARAARL